MAKIVISIWLVTVLVAVTQSSGNSQVNYGGFQNLNIGESSVALISELGKPRLYMRNEIAHYWTYPTDHGNAWLSAVIQDGHIVAIYIRSYPGRRSELGNTLGIKLGDPVDRVAQVHTSRRMSLSFSAFAYPVADGFFWIYEERAGKITGIALTREYLLAIPSQMTNDKRNGASVDQAVRLAAPADKKLIAEDRYLHAQVCAAGDSWKIIGHESMTRNKKHYDKLLIVCPSSKFRHYFYFET